MSQSPSESTKPMHWFRPNASFTLYCIAFTGYVFAVFFGVLMVSSDNALGVVPWVVGCFGVVLSAMGLMEVLSEMQIDGKE